MTHDSDLAGLACSFTIHEPAPDIREDEAVEPELAAALLTVMPRNQLRATIESLLSPNDLERGRQAVDALIDAAFAAEADAGHLRRIA